MKRCSDNFARLLSVALDRVAFCQAVGVMKVRDELARALNRKSGSTIEYWCKGNVPCKIDIEALARELIKRSDLDRGWLEQFLDSAGYPSRERVALCQVLFRTTSPASDIGSSLLEHNHTFITQNLAFFIAGPPITHVRQFFGRHDELAFIFDALQRFPLENIAIVGKPRSGKTSLLHYLKQITTASPDQLRPGQRTDWLSEPSRYRWVFVDFQDARMRDLGRLLPYLLTSLHIPVPTPCDLPQFLDMVSEHLRDPTIILMDEIGAALSAPALDSLFWCSLRSLGTTQTGGKLAFIFTAHDRPDIEAQAYGKPSPFFNIFLQLQLGPMAASETLELIHSSPLPFTPSDIDWIVDQSECWPALLQLLCRARLRALQAGKTDSSWKEEGLQQIMRLRQQLAQAKSI